MLKKIIKRCFSIMLVKSGFSDYMARYHAQLLYEDLFKEKRYTYKEKWWALKRGFFVNQIKVYDLNETNYKNYLSDYDYHKMLPLNKSEYSHWVNDKLTLKYTLSKYDEYLPQYFFCISNSGNVIKLMNASHNLTEDIEGIIQLLKEQIRIVAKRVAGSCGTGLYMLQYTDDIFEVNSIQYKEDEFKEFLKSLRGYLFTEFIVQNKQYAKIYSGAVHTLRIQTIRQEEKKAECLFAFIRWGNKNGQNDIAVKEMEECVTAIVNRVTGEITEGFYVDENNNYITCKEHPVSQEHIIGVIPNWGLILNKCLEMHNYLSQLEYLGFDVVVTDEAFKICEINTASSIRAVQRVMPLLKDEKTRGFFTKYMS